MVLVLVVPISALKPRHVYAYMDKRPHTIANREKATLSDVVTECLRRVALQIPA